MMFRIVIALSGAICICLGQAPAKPSIDGVVVVLFTERGFVQDEYVINEGKVRVIIRNHGLLDRLEFDFDRIVGNDRATTRVSVPLLELRRPSHKSDHDLTPGEYRLSARGFSGKPCIIRVLPKGQSQR